MANKKPNKPVETPTPSVPPAAEGTTRFAQESKAAAVTLYRPIGADSLQKAKRLNLPSMIKPGEVPIGCAIIGRVVSIAKDFTGRKDMDNARHLRLRIMTEAGPVERLFPVTGVMRNTLGKTDAELEKHVGKVLGIQREPDGVSKKYSKSMFQFAVYDLPDDGTIPKD